MEVKTDNAAISLRKTVSLSRQQVAEILEIAEAKLQQWEEGTEIPRLEPWQVLRLTRLYQCTIEDLDRAFR